MSIMIYGIYMNRRVEPGIVGSNTKKKPHFLDSNFVGPNTFLVLVILSNNIPSAKVRRIKPITNPTNSPTNIKIRNKREMTYGCRRKDERRERCAASSWWRKDDGGPRWMLAERKSRDKEWEREIAKRKSLARCEEEEEEGELGVHIADFCSIEWFVSQRFKKIWHVLKNLKFQWAN